MMQNFTFWFKSYWSFFRPTTAFIDIESWLNSFPLDECIRIKEIVRCIYETHKETILKEWESTKLMDGFEFLAENKHNDDVDEELFLRNGIEELMLESSKISQDGELTQNGDSKWIC